MNPEHVAIFHPIGLINFSQPQKKATELILRFVQEPVKYAKELLLWAVPGAGKTEVMFPALEYALQRNKNILIATPRKDVVLELTSRLQQAFPNIGLISLHGDSLQKGEIGPFVVATTHQAMNFYHYFDLVVIDEVDAYPYHNNPMLQNAVNRAAHPSGQKIYLTATPSKELLARVKKKQVELVTIPARYHGYPLIEPRIFIERKLSTSIKEGKLLDPIRKFVEQVIERNRQAFIFVPNIDWISPIVQMILAKEQQESVGTFHWIEGTYSDDEQRLEKVKAFRSGEIRLLVTTTILERGVNVPYSDCLIIGADAPIFDASALIQMSGRVGRSQADPNGSVWFLGQSYTRSMLEAIRYIRHMNHEARALGYIRSDEDKHFSFRAMLRDMWKRR